MKGYLFRSKKATNFKILTILSTDPSMLLTEAKDSNTPSFSWCSRLVNSGKLLCFAASERSSSSKASPYVLVGISTASNNCHNFRGGFGISSGPPPSSFSPEPLCRGKNSRKMPCRI